MGKSKPHSNRHKWVAHEDAFLRKHAGKLSAVQIGAELNIPPPKVRDYARRNRIPLQRHGEYMHNALLNSLLVDMLIILKDAGYTANQIKAAFNLKASKKTINDAVLEGIWGS